VDADGMGRPLMPQMRGHERGTRPPDLLYPTHRKGAMDGPPAGSQMKLTRLYFFHGFDFLIQQ
jgi:hypothetical protein